MTTPGGTRHEPDSLVEFLAPGVTPADLPIDEGVSDDYIVLTQRPIYTSETAGRNEVERPDYIKADMLCFLRPYQLKAIHVLQQAV